MYTTNTGVERWNTIFQILSAPPRRQLIDSLLHAGPHEMVPLPSAANPPNDPRPDRQLHVNLIHDHLPRLANAGYVDWDQHPFQAQRGPEFEEIGSVLTALQSFQDYPLQLQEACHRLPESEAGI